MQRLNLVRGDLYKIFSALGFKTGCEIGVAEGKNARVICDNIQGVKLFGVDTWPDENYYESMLRRMDSCIDDGSFVPVRKSSTNALRGFKSKSLDFVYIDADHSYDSVIRDITKWSAKIRKGGIVSGHDYFRKKGFDVIRAVNDYVDTYKIKSLFVLANEGRWDTKNTWFWVK